MQGLRPLARAGFAWIDELYRRRHRLQRVGPMLFVARAFYPGPPVRFADGTCLSTGDAYGTLHFDNSRIAELGESSRIRNGVHFGRLLRQSFAELAEASRGDPALHDILAFNGVTWLRAHGRQVGFVSEPLPNGLRRRLLAVHFRLLRWVFAPSLRTSAGNAPEPRVFWVTRSALLANFARRDQ